MSSMKGAANSRNQPSSGKQAFLPPKCPFPVVSPSYGDYGSIGPKGIPKPREANRHHQRTSSESFLIEEQPSWLDDLLNEPETPVKKGAHRRSSSDSFAYIDANSMYSGVDLVRDDYRHRTTGSVANNYAEAKTFGRPQMRGWDQGINMLNYQSTALSPRNKGMNIGSSIASRDTDMSASTLAEKQEQVEIRPDLRGTCERREGSHLKQPQSETDTKRVKQQFAQRSRVRKLQYIAELERNVQALQAEGMEVSAELEFVDKQNLILNMENKSLKQRLDSLAQEHLIKKFQQEMLEREIARLRMLLQKQQVQQQQPSPSQSAPTHSRSKSRDLDSQFSGLSLNRKEANSERESIPGPLRT